MSHIISYRVENLPVRALVKANQVNIQPKIGYPKIGCVFQNESREKRHAVFQLVIKKNGVKLGSIYLNLCLHVIV